MLKTKWDGAEDPTINNVPSGKNKFERDTK